jgi:hypothetical protein
MEPPGALNARRRVGVKCRILGGGGSFASDDIDRVKFDMRFWGGMKSRFIFVPIHTCGISYQPTPRSAVGGAQLGCQLSRKPIILHFDTSCMHCAMRSIRIQLRV